MFSLLLQHCSNYYLNNFQTSKLFFMAGSKILVGFLAGAAIGALAGILFAPDKGSKTRKKIASKSGDISDSLKKSFNNFVDGVKEMYTGAKDEMEELDDKAKSTLHQAKSDAKKALS
jgi:gas vesicle protein